jgi:delta8-fatty-acid desaturase
MPISKHLHILDIFNCLEENRDEGSLKIPSVIRSSATHNAVSTTSVTLSASRSSQSPEIVTMSTVAKKDRLWTRQEIEGQIAEGRKIIILGGKVLKADSWIKFHPGGEMAILHLVGRDGTDEIKALHSQATQEFMQKFVVGRIEGHWRNFIPPVQGGEFRIIAEHECVERSEQECEQTSSSSSSTAPPTPTFDAVDRNGDVVRRRREDAPAASLSSASSISLSEDPSKTSAMNARTEAEISSDLLKYPSLDSASQDSIVTKYRALEQQLRTAGLFDCPYRAYAFECTRYVALFAAFVYFLNTQNFFLSAVFLGLLWHQLVFTVHDAGHMGITHSFHLDTTIGIVIADFIGGLSVCWWKHNHNVHHIVTNSPEHDPDIEHLPFLAISHRFFDSLKSTYYDRIMDFDAVARFTVQYQDYMYYPLLLMGRFNLYVLSWTYLFSSKPPRQGPASWHWYLELAGQAFFWTWFGYFTVYRSIPTAGLRIMFVLVSHMVTAPLHVQITLSHFAMSTADLGPNESFPQKMLRTTMDVACPSWLDFVHGGLQFQAIHHLFPRMPRHNLRKAQPFVMKFCDEVAIPYTIYGFVDGNKEVLGRLGEIGQQVKVWEDCRRVAARDLVEGKDAF